MAKVSSQMEVFVLEDTFVPTARLTTIRTLFVVAPHDIWAILQMDVKLAFLNGYLKEEVYVEQPPGFLVNWL